ncbi:MAG: four helix bundle protein [Bacteroidota bacterium]
MNHKELDVWKNAVDLSVDIYKIISTFPNDEKYGLSSQIKRSAISIASNIAEGCGRKSDKELINFLHISMGSLAELETQIIIAERIELISNLNKIHLDEKIEITGKLIMGFIRYLKNKTTIRE